MSRWGSMPLWWVNGGRLTEFNAAPGQLGVHITALKLYLLLAVKVRFETKSATLSYSEIELGLDVSRPMIRPAVDRLVELGLLDVTRGRTNVLTLRWQGEERRFAKVPSDLVAALVRELSLRSRTCLAALKLYLYLLNCRDSKSSVARIAHTTLQEKTGVRPNEIRRGLDHLVNHKMITIMTDAPSGNAGHPVNAYKIRGL